MSKFVMVTPASITDAGTFTRASTGTYIDKDGVLQTAAVDVPRFDRDKGLLVETAATNLDTASADIGTWSMGLGTISANAATAPDGTVTADKFIPSAVGGFHVFYKDIAPGGSGQTVTRKLFFEAAGYAAVSVRVGNTSETAAFQVAIDLALGDVMLADAYGGGVLESYSLQYLPAQGFYCLSLTGSVPGVSTYRSTVYCYQNRTTNFFTGDGSSGILVWGADFKVGGDSSYIPTAGATATRAADVLTAKLVSNIAEPAVGTGADPAVWAAGTNWATDSQVTRTTTHKIYQRLAPGGVDAATPEADVAAGGTKWAEVQPTNRWRALDQANDSQSSAADEIHMALQPGDFADAVGVLNAEGSEVSVRVAGTDYDETVNLVSRTATNWLEWITEPFDFGGDAYFQNLPVRLSNVVTVTVRNPGGTAKVGNVVLGRSRLLGYTEQGATAEIIDYSTRQTNAFGVTNFVKRTYSKRMNVTLWVPAAKTDFVYRKLAAARGTPTLYVGAENLYACLIVNGAYRSTKQILQDAKWHKCLIDIEGVT